jgi:hypothetical protein
VGFAVRMGRAIGAVRGAAAPVGSFGQEVGSKMVTSAPKPCS